MPNGYGSFSMKRKTVYAHRLTLERKIGRKLLAGEQALHSCDRPACVNPDHLRVGDHAANMADKSDRDRFTRTPGERHGMHKLTDSQVIRIREELAGGRVQREVAAEFGVSQSMISFIRNRRHWRHI
jgi:hypothetical protein